LPQEFLTSVIGTNSLACLFKYFSKHEYAENFISKGEVYFNSLSYFLSCEEVSKRDPYEDVNVYKPVNGLQVTKVSSHEKFVDPRTLISRLNNPHRIFVFCTSAVLNEQLWKKFNSVSCVEITNREKFKERIAEAIVKPILRLKNKTLLAGEVEYFNSQDEPGTRHACPDQIVMSKIDEFSHEKEYRFAFAIDKEAFDVDNVSYSLAYDVESPTYTIDYKVIRLGNLSDICRITSVKED
jgi:hypothetical protein